MTEEGDIILNFVNADVKDVAKAILGDFLKLNYAVGANVQGTVTIETSRPLGRNAVLPVLEQALRLNGMALVKTNDIYKIVPAADAPREAGISRANGRRGTTQAGYGVEIVPLRYIGAAEMQRLLEPLAPAQGSLHSDPVRNVLIIEGTQQERSAMLDNIALFDVDWLSGMSFALYTPRYTDAQGLAKELGEVLGGRNSPLSGLVKLVPIDRLNAVLAISPQARYLEQLQRWVDRLDRPGQSMDRRIFVYHVQNGRATDVAGVLLKVVNGGDAWKAAGRQTAGGERSTFAGGAIPPGGIPGEADAQDADLDFGGGAGISASGLENVSITADEPNNALVILATPKEYGVVEAALRQLDTVPMQVMLEASIAEVTLTDQLKYGVQYFFQFGNSHEIRLSNNKTAAISASYPGFSYTFSSGDDIKVILDALSAVTHVDVVSSPRVLVLNNQTATLQVGDQVPIATSTSQSTSSSDAPIVSSIQYHDTGVILKVTPRVNQGGMVMLDISQEVSDVITTDSSTIDSPTIQQRKINSTVAVQDNETIALGGLMKNSRTRGKTGIPLLKDIPVVGNLFRSTEDTSGKTELMVLITPHVVDNLQRARTVTEELRLKLPAVQPLFEAR
ncbi:type II secretion system secretin GspD [Parvibaculum sp.]|uniref:type II secretion system secretin GspD n=1 Tax=Parvibaculum sp. TaxID=2024848 RepID=UPI002C69CBC0|nr:type II secretion system secretin GspD [Parvibaculum sp.]HUD52835.1 type II secretion system secretin GspD [Parvibaculum sp.]